jgi:hypothetical protein
MEASESATAATFFDVGASKPMMPTMATANMPTETTTSINEKPDFPLKHFI